MPEGTTSPRHRRGFYAVALIAVAASMLAGPALVQPAGAASGAAGGHATRMLPMRVGQGRVPAVNKRYFGMHVPKLADGFPQAPVGAVDLTTNRVYWPQIEKSPGVFDFSLLDTIVEQAQSHGAKTLVVLGQTPSFHSTTPDAPRVGATVPVMAAWKTYVRKVVDRYGTKLEYQIWPEPNVINNWAGTTQQLADLIVAAAKIIHHRAPGSLVVAPPMVLRLRYQRVFMRELFESKVDGVPLGHYFDVVTIDPYPLQAGTPESAAALTTKAQRILDQTGVSAPLWVVEINYGVPVGGGGTATRFSERTQAAYVARTYLLNASQGVQRVYWLGWLLYPTLGVNMVEPDLVTLLAAGHAYRLMDKWLVGQRPQGCRITVSSGLYSCSFVHEGRTSRAYWKTSGHTHVRAPAGARHVQKATGEKSRTHAGQRIRVSTVPVWVTH